MTVSLIVSGGQSGADLGGLKAGKLLGIPTGGYMPKGWITEAGSKPEYAEEYGMTEWDTHDYLGRTKQNARLGDVTVIFGRRSPGSNRTEEFCRQLSKQCMWINFGSNPTNYRKANINAFKIWIARNKVETLNVAGNRESVNPGICKYVCEFLLEALIKQ
jgi:hypothetical protein